jgi:EAL domain-containing protein (putative c-di-GMP-specific phosphodiesterase class I)
VLFTVCKQLTHWSSTYGIYISYNMSAKEFTAPDLADVVGKALQNGGSTDPKYLKIEITETACVQNLEESILRMESLSDLGVELFIDDFGTGSSSLTYLKQLPATLLKIDRNFVSGIDTNDSERDFLAHIIRMVKSRGKEVLVEGIDNEKQAELLAGMGCSYMQGFYFSKPMKAENLENILENRSTLP